MIKTEIGPVTAYADAVKAGYTGTREEFARDQAGFAQNASAVAGMKQAVEQTVEGFPGVVEQAKQDVSDEGNRQVKRIADAAPDLELDRAQIEKNKKAIEGKITNPAGGTSGQVLTKTAGGEEWKDPTGGDVPTKLSDLQEDSTHRTVTDDEKKSWNDKYEKPEGGIPASDLAKGAIPEESASIDDASISAEKTWSSQKISNELNDCVKFVKITVNLIGSEGNTPLGNTVYVYEIVDNIETLSYSTVCPTGTITIRVPHGIQYRITASADVEGFYAPTEVTGVAINDSEATIRYTELAYPKTIRDLQTLAQMGLAGDVVAVGDEFTTTYNYDGNEFEMPWIVTDIKEVEFEDGSTGQGVFLELKYATIESIQFDAPHQEVATEETAIEGLYYAGRTDSTYTLLSLSAGDAIPYSDYTYIYHDTIRDTSLNIYRYGHNRVLTSAYRQWLNSYADKGQWWKAPKVGYCPPSQLNQIKGFMAGLPQEFLDCVAKVKRTYYTNSVTDGSAIDVLYDKFFAATGTELYGTVNDNEGTYWPYYKEVTGLSAPSNAANTGRIKHALNAKTSPLYCWSLSCIRGYSYCVWCRGTSGQLYDINAYYSYRAVPDWVLY